MNRPVVHPDNHEALYDYYENKVPSKRLMKSVVRASGIAYKPRLHFADGAEDELAEIKSRGDRLIYASAHFKITDQFALFAAMMQSGILASEAEKIFLIGKPSYATSRLLGRGFDAAGWLPAFRQQDYPESLRARAAAAKGLFRVSTSKIVDGWDLLLFTGGTRNQGDPRASQKVLGGIGRIASAVSEKGVGVAIVPVVPWWGDTEDSSFRSPDIFFSNPIKGPFLTSADAVVPLQTAMDDGIRQVSEISTKDFEDKRVLILNVN